MDIQRLGAGLIFLSLFYLLIVIGNYMIFSTVERPLLYIAIVCFSIGVMFIAGGGDD